MIARLLLVSLAWLAVMGVFAVLLQSPVRPARPRPRVEPAAAASSITRLLRESDGKVHFPGWTVTKALSAHHVMVVDVETDRPEQAKQIAVQLVEPVRDRYEEVLIYIRRPGTAGELAARRIQWTPRGGYVEVNYEAIR